MPNENDIGWFQKEEIKRLRGELEILADAVIAHEESSAELSIMREREKKLLELVRNASNHQTRAEDARWVLQWFLQRVEEILNESSSAAQL
jgi:hypothetical protein